MEIGQIPTTTNTHIYAERQRELQSVGPQRYILESLNHITTKDLLLHALKIPNLEEEDEYT